MSANYCLRRLGSRPSIRSIQNLLELTSDITIIGRNKLVADLFLDSTKTSGLISRIHARIIRTSKEDGEQYELCDTSLNGTYVNDHKVECSVLLKDGDLIAFGHIRGAAIDPGAFAPQKNSEFLYKFERIKREPSSDQPTKQSTSILGGDTNISLAEIHNHKNRSSASTPVAYNDNNINNYMTMTTSGKRIKLSFQAESDASLQSLVESISAKDTDKSDDEFSLSVSPVRPRSAPRIEHLKRDIVLISEKQSTKICKTTDNCQGKLSGAKKRKQNLQKENKTRSRSDDGVIYTHECCASIDCYHPSNVRNTWVQCDDCDKWFHLKCTGLSDRAASRKENLFHCGCS